MKRWLLMVILWGAGAVPSAASPILRWAPADTTIAPGQQATLSIMLDDTLTVRTVEIYMTYDSDIISSVSGGPGAMFDGFNLFSGFEEVDPGNPGLWHGYCVILGADDWAVGPGELFSWTVLGEAEGISGSVPESVKLLPPGGGEYAAVVLPGIDIRVALASPVPVHPADDAALNLYPNPFNPRVQVDFLPGGQGGGLLEIFDLRGRRVVTLWRGVTRELEQVTWDGQDAQGRALPSGVYTFSLTGKDGSRTTKRGTLVR
jgi:hypothetical protein